MIVKNTTLAAMLFALAACHTPQQTKDLTKSQTEIFTNPLFDKGADPWVVQHDSVYHYCYSGGGSSIYIRSSAKPAALRQAEARKIWTAPPDTQYSREVWAPELHRIDNRWYVYFAADDGKNENHRMHVLRSKTGSIESEFEYAGKISDSSDKWAIDGTVLQYREKRYFIWSGWEGDANEAQHLYIAEMTSPTTIGSARVLISSPDQEWEQRGSGNGLPTINEGPEAIVHGDKVFLTYSASGSWSDHYCLGMLELTGTDPLSKDAWKKSSGPIFESTDCVTSPGHASFITIGQQDWIVYHVARHKGAGWNRYVKMQPFYWENGRPVFGKPVQDGVLLPVTY